MFYWLFRIDYSGSARIGSALPVTVFPGDPPPSQPPRDRFGLAKPAIGGKL
jgi:hypothetical protein